MVASMFNLDSRLTDLQSTDDEQRVARQLRDAAAPASRPGRLTLGTARRFITGGSPARSLRAAS